MALLLAPGLGGCKSPAERLVELRREALAAEAALYRAYGGSDVANAVNDVARQAGSGAGLGDLVKLRADIAAAGLEAARLK